MSNCFCAGFFLRLKEQRRLLRGTTMSNKRRKTTNNFKGQEKSTYILLE
jgi:hypothetical protein